MPTPIEVGTRVAYRASFLRSIMAYTGWMPFARGIVVSIDERPPATAVVRWSTAPDTRHVLVANLWPADELHLEPV